MEQDSGSRETDAADGQKLHLGQGEAETRRREVRGCGAHGTHPVPCGSEL